MTADGLEHTFALNYLAPFLLTNLLLDRLIASAPARIVSVSSGAHTAGRLDFDDLQGERKYSGQRAYNASKLANVMFTYELARRMRGTGVTSTVLHPGVVGTAFGAEDQSAFFTVILPLIRPFMKTTGQGAATSIYLASSRQVEGVTGRYFANSKPKNSSRSSYDIAAAGRLWQVVRPGRLHAHTDPSPERRQPGQAGSDAGRRLGETPNLLSMRDVEPASRDIHPERLATHQRSPARA